MDKHWFLIVLLFISVNSFSQKSNDIDTIPNSSKLVIPTVDQLIDSLVLDKKLEWSVRLVSNFKQQLFRLSNNGYNLNYAPNNPFGIGFGFAHQKIVVDIIFNLKGKGEDQTSKFSMDGSIVLDKHYFGFIFENVHGYNIKNNQNDIQTFREDISIFSTAINYLYLFDSENFTVRGMKSGLKDQKKTAFSYGVGGFLLINNLSANGTIIPAYAQPFFNEEAEIEHLTSVGVGVLAGGSAYFVLPANFFSAFSFAPGLGLEYKKIQTVTSDYSPSNPLIYNFNFFGAVGYNGKKYYVHVNLGTDLYKSDLDFNNESLLRVTKGKLIFGYNLDHLNFKSKKNKAY
jgi:hypothetical protein